MKWKPKIVIAAVVLVAAMVLSCLGYDSFVQDVGYLAAGWLFATATPEVIQAVQERRDKNNGKGN